MTAFHVVLAPWRRSPARALATASVFVSGPDATGVVWASDGSAPVAATIPEIPHFPSSAFALLALLITPL